jgi:hypothetical protein
MACGFVRSQSNTDFNLVLLSDTTVVAARIQTAELFEGRYIAAEERTQNLLKGGESRVTSIFTYAIDCKAPRKIALVGSQFNLEFKPNAEPRWGINFAKEEYKKGFYLNAMDYQSLKDFNEGRAKVVQDQLGKRLPVFWPESPNLVVEYACAVAGNATSAKSISAELIKTGGITTLKELACEITFKKGEEISASVSFDDESGFVKVNEKWKLNPFINAQSIGFTSDDGAVTRINRSNGKFSITPKEGEPYATGMCDVARNALKKF